MVSDKKRKIIDLLFAVAVVVLMILPAVQLNTSPQLESSQENRMMTEWPGWGFDEVYNPWYGHYLEDRVAYREEAVAFFTKYTYKIFGEFAEELHMFGKDGHVFPADEGYIKSYQHLNTDQQLMDNLAEYLQNTNEYLTKKGIPFVFFVGLDKKSVYDGYFPDGIHVNESVPSNLELLCQRLDEANVGYIIPVSEFRERAKEEPLIYNMHYDTAHWNEHGAFYGIQILGEKFIEQGSEVPLLKEEDFIVSYQEMEGVEFLDIPLNDTIPVYKRAKKQKVSHNKKLTHQTLKISGTSMQHTMNKKSKSKETILILHDSFFDGKVKFLQGNYRQVYMCSKRNYESIAYFVNLLEPDLVIFETAERALVDDLYAFDNLRGALYQPPYSEYKGKTKKVKENKLDFRLISAENGLLKEMGQEESKILLELNGKEAVCALRGELTNANQYDVYVKYGEQYFESNGALVQRLPIELGENEVYAAFRISSRKEGEMQMIAVDKETLEEHLLQIIQIEASDE